MVNNNFYELVKMARTSNENWYALKIAMEFSVTPEKAFKMLDTGRSIGLRENSQSYKVLDDAIALRKKGCTLKVIGNILGIPLSTIAWRLKKSEILNGRNKNGNRKKYLPKVTEMQS